MKRRWPIMALLPAMVATHANAGQVITADYAALRLELLQVVDFERLPPRDEPGFNLDMPLYARGAWIGERFAGQDVVPLATGHDDIDGAPDGPNLRIAGGAEKRNLSVARHRGFGSNALFPLGETGFPELHARGEGALAILFDHDQAAVGFRVHAGYPAPLGTTTVHTGHVEVRFFARDGRRIASLQHEPGRGISEFGYRTQTGRAEIAGILILNTDPGGIAVDDIIFALPGLLG
ncbi:hypothetical protein [Tropicimonas marinistellae]|uniref:hypothetical protein n=1 Tax=Tropicimonas marinistellae TaxID=1739787 RepID=UPI000A3FF3F2|nr:hypothetical protein [Tropicimonas marinistellae]